MEKVLIIPILFAADVLSTYLFFYFYTKKYPKHKDWAQIELNKLSKFCWRRWGLHKGTQISVLISLPFVLLIMYLFQNISNFFFGMLIGVYYITFLIHYVNFKKWIFKKPVERRKKNGI